MALKYHFFHGSGAIQDGTLRIEHSLRSVSVPLKEIIGFHRYMNFGMDTLVVASGSPGGKVKSEVILLGRNNVPEAFVEELIAHTPRSANLLHLPKKEALRKMGVAGRVNTAMIVVGILILLLAGGCFYPQIYHGINDRELVAVSVEDIYAGALPSSNFINLTTRLSAAPLLVSYQKWWSISGAFFEEHRKGFYPIVPNDWKQGDPVKMVLMVDGGYALNNIAPNEGREIAIQGVIRNVLWERFYWSGSMDAFSRHVKSPVEDPIVVEYNSRPLAEMIWSVGGIVGLMLLFLGIEAWRSRSTKRY